MKRIFAAVLLVCLLLTMTTAVFAEPAETEEPVEEETVQEEAPAEPEKAEPEEEAAP